MDNFDIQSFLDKRRFSTLLSRYWSTKKSPFYILRYTAPYFIVAEDFQNRWFGKFFAIPRDIYPNGTTEITYLFGVTSRALAAIEEKGVGFGDYIKIYGEYHLKKFLNTLELPLKEEYLIEKILIDHRMIENDEYKPKIINHSIDLPENRYDIAKRKESLRFRILGLLYDFNHKKSELLVDQESEDFQDLVFCDEADLKHALKRLKDESVIEEDNTESKLSIKISTKGEKLIEEHIGKSKDTKMSIEERRLAAIMFMDVVGYTSLMRDDESKARNFIEQYRKNVNAIIPFYNGTINQYTGDGIFCVFSSSVLAVQFALEMQTKHRPNEYQVRIGIHLGDVVMKDDDIYGDAVNVASRIEPLAKPGGICISSKVNDEIKNQKVIKTISVGFKDLKNIDESIEVFEVSLERAQSSFEDVGGIPGILKTYEFESNKSLAELLDLLLKQQLPYEVADGMFEFLAERGFTDQQYYSTIECGLVEYKTKYINHGISSEEPDLDNIGWFELTELGKNVQRELSEKD